MNLSVLSKSELEKLTEKLIRDYLEDQGYDFIQIVEGKIRTKFRIKKDRENYIIKIGGYRYNEYAQRGNYAWFAKKNFDLKKYDYLFFVMYINNIAHILRLPSDVFVDPLSGRAFTDKDGWNNKQAPEYGIIMDDQTIPDLLGYEEAAINLDQ